MFGSKFRITSFSIINAALLITLALLVLYPLYFIAIASISDPYLVIRGEVTLYPRGISLEGFFRIFNYHPFWRAYLNTVVYTVTGTLLNVLLTMLAAYSLGRKFVGKKAIVLYMTFTMFFGGGLIPTFLQVKSLGLYNSPLVMVLLNAVGIWNIMIARSFLQSNLPEELYEAAMMDGCTHFRYFFNVVLPLSKAIIAVLVVYYAVGHWNDFMTGLIYLQSAKWMPLQVIMRDLLASLNVNSQIDSIANDITDVQEMIRIAESVKYCTIIVSTFPVIILYIFTQKYFVKGVMIGSLKA